MLLYHPESIEIRFLPNVEARFNRNGNQDPDWKKKARLTLGEDLANSPPKECEGHNFISCHWYN